MMNKSSFFYALTCCWCMFMFSACERSEIQTSKEVIANDKPIEFRGPCQLCPNDNECCCGIQLAGLSTSGSITICGVAGGTGTCPQITNCLGAVVPPPTSESATLTSSNPKLPFCIKKGQAGFWVMNTGATPVTLSMTCDVNTISTQFTLQPNERRYFRTTLNCEILDC